MKSEEQAFLDDHRKAMAIVMKKHQHLTDAQVIGCVGSFFITLILTGCDGDVENAISILEDLVENLSSQKDVIEADWITAATSFLRSD